MKALSKTMVIAGGLALSGVIVASLALGRALVDTGATDIVFTVEDARRAGLDPDSLTFLGRARTANGEVATAFTRAETIALGPILHENVSVTVNSGEMPGSLLGMAYLSRFDRLEISGDRLSLVP